MKHYDIDWVAFMINGLHYTLIATQAVLVQFQHTDPNLGAFAVGLSAIQSHMPPPMQVFWPKDNEIHIERTIDVKV